MHARRLTDALLLSFVSPCASQQPYHWVSTPCPRCIAIPGLPRQGPARTIGVLGPLGYADHLNDATLSYCSLCALRSYVDLWCVPRRCVLGCLLILLSSSTALSLCSLPSNFLTRPITITTTHLYQRRVSSNSVWASLETNLDCLLAEEQLSQWLLNS